MIALVTIGGIPGIQVIGHEKQPEDKKEDKDLDQDDDPKTFPNGHRPKSVIVKSEYV